MKHESLLTKVQLKLILKAWGVDDPVPGKGKSLIVTWPKPTQPEIAKVTWTDLRSTYGQRLYRVEMGSCEEILKPV